MFLLRWKSYELVYRHSVEMYKQNRILLIRQQCMNIDFVIWALKRKKNLIDSNIHFECKSSSATEKHQYEVATVLLAVDASEKSNVIKFSSWNSEIWTDGKQKTQPAAIWTYYCKSNYCLSSLYSSTYMKKFSVECVRGGWSSANPNTLYSNRNFMLLTLHAKCYVCYTMTFTRKTDLHNTVIDFRLWKSFLLA